MIREYVPEDIVFIEELGRILNPNYKFKINQFTKCLVYVMSDKIVAFITYFIMYEKAEIVDIAVISEYQGKHVGAQLLTYAVANCKANNCESITLEVRASNTYAIEFYKRHGFRESSVRKNYYDNGEDALLMTRIL